MTQTAVSGLAPCAMSEDTLVFIMIYHLKNAIGENDKLSETLSTKPGLGGVTSAGLWREDVLQTLRMAACHKAKKWPKDWLNSTPRKLAKNLLKP